MNAQKKNPEKIVIDGNNATLGRLASFAAKQALLGKHIIILNCKNMIITGNARVAIKKYKERRTRGGDIMKGPNFPSKSYMIVKRAIRGMLSYKQSRGDEALKRILCFDDTPKEYENAPKVSSAKEKPAKSIVLSDISKELK